jgi:hypothetical protein
MKHNKQQKHIGFCVCYKKKLTKIHPVNNIGKLNIFLTFIFFSVGLSDSRALRWIKAHFMGIEVKVMVMGSGGHHNPQNSLNRHQVGGLCWMGIWKGFLEGILIWGVQVS